MTSESIRYSGIKIQDIREMLRVAGVSKKYDVWGFRFNKHEKFVVPTGKIYTISSGVVHWLGYDGTPPKPTTYWKPGINDYDNISLSLIDLLDEVLYFKNTRKIRARFFGAISGKGEVHPDFYHYERRGGVHQQVWGHDYVSEENFKQ